MVFFFFFNFLVVLELVLVVRDFIYIRGVYMGFYFVVNKCGEVYIMVSYGRFFVFVVI